MPVPCADLVGSRLLPTIVRLINEHDAMKDAGAKLRLARSADDEDELRLVLQGADRVVLNKDDAYNVGTTLTFEESDEKAVRKAMLGTNFGHQKLLAQYIIAVLTDRIIGPVLAADPKCLTDKCVDAVVKEAEPHVSLMCNYVMQYRTAQQKLYDAANDAPWLEGAYAPDRKSVV